MRTKMVDPVIRKAYYARLFCVYRVASGKDMPSPDLRNPHYYKSLLDAIAGYRERSGRTPGCDWQITYWPDGTLLNSQSHVLYKSWLEKL